MVGAAEGRPSSVYILQILQHEGRLDYQAEEVIGLLGVHTLFFVTLLVQASSSTFGAPATMLQYVYTCSVKK